MIELRNIWKIFGQLSDDAIRAICTGALPKQDAMKRFDCVIGVANVSLTIEEGEIFCIMGLSGSGKSTLVRHINRLIDPTSGTIIVDGVDVGALPPASLRQLRSKKIGMVFQNVALLPHRSVRDNVAFPFELRGVDRGERQRLADAALKTVQLDGWGDRFPSELSGGMQQRVGLARALASDPDILLMDEPFSALDPLIRRQLQDEFLSLSRVMKKTTVFITHDLDEAIRLGTRIAVIRDGAIVQVDTPERLVASPVDSYVADFVRNISPLRVIRASSLMERLPEAATSTLERQADSNADLKELISLMIENDGSVVIVDGQRPVGRVTKERLLSALQGIEGHA